jgi:hypothetical protein
MTFFEWLKIQVKRDDPIGDIATDIIDDARINSLDYQTVEEWKRRVWFKSDDRDIRQAFTRAKNEYEKLSD